MGSVNPGGDAVHLNCRWCSQEDYIWPLPPGFQVLGLMSADPDGVSDLEKVRDYWSVQLSSVCGSQGSPNLLLDELECLQMGFKRRAVSMISNVGVKEVDSRWWGPIEYLKWG